MSNAYPRMLSDADHGVALKTITSELPLEGKIAAKACEKLTPKLLTQLSNVSLAFSPLGFYSHDLALVEYSTRDTH